MKKTLVFGSLALLAAASWYAHHRSQSSTHEGEFCTITCQGKGACCSSEASTSADKGKLVTACSLSSDAQTTRLTDLKQTLFAKIQTSQELPEGFDLVFPADTITRKELEIFVAFERGCCASANGICRMNRMGKPFDFVSPVPRSSKQNSARCCFEQSPKT